ncbi:MAG: endonuclease MutS2, partial [Solobacterium sp.]|nr:endonuclease MutS2 [Solobacterium sp.]
MNNTEQSLELNVILEQVKHCCSFSLGIQEIEQLEPVYDPLIIRHRSRQLKEALECVIRFGPMPFGGIRDLRDTLKNAAKGRVLTAGELVAEMELIRGIRGILNYEESLECDHAELHDIISTLTVHEKTEKYLSRCINEYGEVKDNASDELKIIRRQLQSADADIAAAVNRFMAAHSSSVVDSIVTYRNDRAVVLVKASDKNQFGGIIYGDSASGQASYVEPAAVVAANNRKQQL